MKRNIFIVITVLLCFILQSTVFRWLAFGGIAPNLLVIITATFGFMCGQKCGLWFGFFSGMLYYIFFGNVLCFYALIFMYLGFANGYFKQIFFKEDIKLPILLITLSDLSYGLVSYILLFLLRGRFHFLHYLMHVIVPEIIYTVLVTLILYPLIRMINGKLDGTEKRSEDGFA